MVYLSNRCVIVIEELLEDREVARVFDGVCLLASLHLVATVFRSDYEQTGRETTSSYFTK
jgi:hypothetical protein